MQPSPINAAPEPEPAPVLNLNRKARRAVKSGGKVPGKDRNRAVKARVLNGARR